jgi:hypothetical protein
MSFVGRAVAEPAELGDAARGQLTSVLGIQKLPPGR